jgi:hypothetical protein
MQRPMLLAPRIFLLLALLILMTEPARAGGWVTLMEEDFEGDFPGANWHIGRTGAPYLWGQRDCNPHRGSYSMWGGGGGTLGSQIPCSGMYTTGYATTLSYGPVDLSEASDVRVNFAHWTWLSSGDFLGVGFSNDGGVTWQEKPILGNWVNTCGGWCEWTFNQSEYGVPIAGKARVYLLFRFGSNASGVNYGAFVDDVSLEAYYASAPRRLYLPLLRR